MDQYADRISDLVNTIIGFAYLGNHDKNLKNYNLYLIRIFYEKINFFDCLSISIMSLWRWKFIYISRRERKKQLMAEMVTIQKVINELERRQIDAEKAKEDLKKFNVLQSRFVIQNNGSKNEAFIELTVKNETNFAVSRAYFHAILSSPNRSVTWAEESFIYQIPGGIEPGEQLTWKLDSNTFTGLNQVPKDRKDLIINITTKRIDGADGKPLYDLKSIEADKKSLESLKAKLAELQKEVQK
jgi:hypothetical protein